MMQRLARTCYRNRWRTLIAWILLVVGLSAIGSAFADEFRNDFTLPGSEAQATTDLLEQSGFGGRGGLSGQIVVASPSGVDDPATRSATEELIDRIQNDVEAVDVISPFDGGEGRIAPDGSVAFAEIDFGDVTATEANDLGEDVREVRDEFVADGTIPQGMQVELGGEMFYEESEFSSEGFGLIAAAVILLVAFGSILAMGLPILTALFGIAGGFALVTLATNFLDIPDFTTATVAMIGIGVGIDYALFIVTRYREELAAGAEPEAAVVRALDTAGRAVLFAGATVVVALLGLLVVGLASVRSVAFAAAAGVLMVMLSSLTLLPAILGFVGRNIDRFGLPHRRRHRSTDRTFWYRWAGVVQRRPVPVALVALVALLVLAAPAMSLRLGFGDASNRPDTDTARRAYDHVEAGFGPGFNGPLFLAIDLRDVSGNDHDEVLNRLAAGLDDDPGIAAVVSAIANEDGSVAMVQAFPTTSPQDAETEALVKRLRDDVVPAATAGADAEVLVGGAVAGVVDFAQVQADRLPVFIGAVLVLSFLLLLATFRSVLIAVKAVIMNLLGIAAAYGVVVAVFQWGWGAGLLGVGEPGPIEAWAPMMLFAIVFGLSMDYEVFLLSRIREEYERTGDNAASVAGGLARTARLITAAAAIMVCVFGGFVFSVDRALQLFGLGLAVAVFLDATIVRLLLVPATMELLGDRNWWLPRWLDRLLPRLTTEADADLAPAIPSPGATRPEPAVPAIVDAPAAGDRR